MSETATTDAIDEKKEEIKNEDNKDENPVMNNIGKFLLSLIFLVFFVLIYFCSSGALLYCIKLAQTNILPTDINCTPYTSSKPEIQEIQTNIFPSGDGLSAKLSFPYDESNSKHMLLDMFRRYKEDPNISNIACYFISIFEKMVCFNYSSLNFSLQFLNQIPELLNILIGPIIYGYIFSIIFIINHLYFIYVWFSQTSWFFKKHSNKDSSSWEQITLLDPVKYGLGWFLVFIAFIIFIVLLFFGFIISSLISIILSGTFLSCLLYKGKLNNEPIQLYQLIQHVLKEYKNIIVGLLSFMIVISAGGMFGWVEGLITLLIIIICLWFSLFIFKPDETDNLSLSKLVSNDLAKKICKEAPAKRTLWNIFMGQKGGEPNIANDLKKLHKQLNK
jgi:hypothetical protein